MVTCEEVFELQVGLPDVVAMQTRQPNLEGTGEIQLRRLVKEALRMRPDRIIVGEVRQEECLDLLIALNSGLPGMCSLHANSAREAIVKLARCRCWPGENVGHGFVVPDRRQLRRPRRAHGEGRRRAPAGARDRRGARAGSRATSSRSPTCSSRAATAGAGAGLPAAPGAVRLGRPRPAARCCAQERLMGALLGLLLGLGLLLVWRSGAARRGRPGTAARAGRRARATCWRRPASRA